MNAADLLELREGRVDFRAFLGRHGDYVRRMVRVAARPIVRRTRPLGANPIELQDLDQVARVEIWLAVHEYGWCCPACPRAADSPEGLERHSIRAHGASLPPRGDIFRFVHGRVGRALDHEVRRYVRRGRFWGVLPTEVEEDVSVERWRGGAQEPDQEARAELSAVVAEARRVLGARAEEILERLALGDPARDEEERRDRRALRVVLGRRVA